MSHSPHVTGDRGQCGLEFFSSELLIPTSCVVINIKAFSRQLSLSSMGYFGPTFLRPVI
jgi:hypothetical protein